MTSSHVPLRSSISACSVPVPSDRRGLYLPTGRPPPDPPPFAARSSGGPVVGLAGGRSPDVRAAIGTSRGTFVRAPIPSASVRRRTGSIVSSTTRSPASAHPTASAAEVVVFPVPPTPHHTAI